MANDELSSLLTQKRKALDAFAIEYQSKLKTVDDDIEIAAKKVDEQISAWEKQLNSFLKGAEGKLQKELAKQLSQSLFSADSGSNLGGLSQNQWASMFSQILGKASRNL